MSESASKDLVLQVLANKGVDTATVTDDALLLQYLTSMEFMEMMLKLEELKGAPLDMAHADIEQIVTFNGLIRWVDATATPPN